MFLALLAGYGWLGWFTVRCLAGRSGARLAVGGLLMLTSLYAPFLLAYSWVFGVVPIVIGGTIAAVQHFKGASGLRRAGLVLAIVVLSLGGQLLIAGSDASSSEQISRCQGQVAIRAIADYRAQFGVYPPTVHDFAIESESASIENQNCPLYNNVNWLYRPSAGRYVVGYWTQWLLVRNVCMHESTNPGWTCGLERWGPFKPGEKD